MKPDYAVFVEGTDEVAAKYASILAITLSSIKHYYDEKYDRKKVVYLKRISMGVLTLPDDLKKGECRQLTAEEEKRLKESVVTK